MFCTNKIEWTFFDNFEKKKAENFKKASAKSLSNVSI